MGDDIFYAGGTGAKRTLLRGDFQNDAGAAPVLASPSARCCRRGSCGQSRVVSSSPADGATSVRRDAAIALDLSLADGGQGLDEATLATSNIQLIRDTDGASVSGTINTTAAGDGIVYQPEVLLDADSTYTFRVGQGIADQSGADLLPFSMSFTTGTEPSALESPATFLKTEVYAGGAVSTSC